MLMLKWWTNNNDVWTWNFAMASAVDDPACFGLPILCEHGKLAMPRSLRSPRGSPVDVEQLSDEKIVLSSSVVGIIMPH